MSICRKLLETLKAATVERQVEDAYNEMLKAEFPGIELTYPYGCDGYFEFEAGGSRHRAIVEYKFDEDMSSKTARSKVLAQVLFYMKRFELDGRPLPTVVLVADRNECFALHANDLVKWLDFDAKWDGAPSNAAKDNPELVLMLASDETRNAYVFDVGEDFDFSAVAQKMKDMAAGTVRKIRVTERNADKVFGVFSKKVVSEPKYSPNDMVALFFAAVTGSGDVYLHPAKKNRLVANGREVRVDGGAWRAFCGHFATTCSPKEKARLSAVCDRLIADATRRRQGAFFTPTEWAARAVDMISETWGQDWRESFVVADPAAGTLNLERDYEFKELYASTLEQSELDIARNYCMNATKFVFDFLNGTDEELFAKAPELKKAIDEKRGIVFFMNPPYSNKSVNKADKTLVAEMMARDGIKGNAVKDILMQFIYRVMRFKKVYGLEDCRIALFSKPVWLQGRGSRTFREKFLKEFKFERGMFFNAGHFSDVSSDWGISFSLWTSGETRDKNSFLHDVMDVDDEGNIVKIGEKAIYNLDGLTPCSDWCKEPVAKAKPVEAPNCSIALNIVEDGKGCYGKSVAGSFGYFCNEGNNIHTLHQFVLFSSPSRHAHGVNITKDNFDRCCAAFAARKLVEMDWKNEKNEFMKPDETAPGYAQFIDDSLVFSLFEPASQQFSIRGVKYKNAVYDIRNHFFFVPSKTMAEWADAAGMDEAYNEAIVADDSYMVKRLATANLSLAAKAVLDKAVELTEKSMKYRKLFNDEHPEFRLTLFDQGWYSIKALLKEYMPNELKEFRALYKKLIEQMRPMVYQLKFLR